MKTIINGGLSSKNSPIYTIDSFMLANTKKNIDGINIEIYLTRDNKIVLLNDEVMKNVGINEQYINSTTLANLKKLNIGTRVKQSKIISLDELLNIFTNKYIMVSLKENLNNNTNRLLINLLSKYIKKHSNVKWYLTSKSTNILNLILSQNIDVKIGKIIDNSYDTAYSFNFYTANIKNINLLKNKNNSTIVFYDIDSRKKYNLISNYYNYFNDLFIIIDNYNIINSNYLE